MRRPLSAPLSLAALTLSLLSASAHAQPAGSGLRSFNTASGLLSRGMNDLAAEEYRKFLSEHGDHEKAPTARYGLAVALFRMGDAKGAEGELEQIADDRNFEFAAESRVLLGQCRLALGENAGAAEAFREVLKRYGSHDLADDAAGLLVEALYRDGDYDGAQKAAADYEAKWPGAAGHDRADLFRGMAELATGEPAKAADRFDALAGRAKDTDLRDRAALLSAQGRHRAGDTDRAAGQYQAVIDSGSAFVPDALLGLAALRHEQGKANESGPLLDRLLTQYPKSAVARDAMLRRGRVRIDLMDYDRAMQDLQAVQQAAKGEDDEAAYWIAKCHLRAGRPEQAATALAEAVEKFPKSRLAPEMRYDLAVAQTRAGQDEQALRTIAEFKSRFADNPLAAEATHLAAVVHHQRKEYDASLAACREFEAKYKDHTLLPAVEFLAAENLLLSGHDADAAAAYAAFLEDHKADERADKAAFRLGSALHRLGKPDEAEPYLARVAKGKDTSPEFRTSLLLLGDIAFGKGDWPAARTYLTEYTSLGLDQPSADDALLKLGLAAARQGDHPAAIASFDTLLSKMPRSEQSLQARFERGQSLVALGRTDEAASEFRQVLEQAPDSRFAPYAHNHLGAIESAKGNQDEAVKHFQAAGNAGGDLEADALFREALAHAAAGRHQEAFDAFSKMVDQFGTSPRAGEAAARRAIELSRLGKPAEALRALDAAKRDGLDARLKDALDYERAWCLRQTKQTDKAAEGYRALIQPGHDATLRLFAMTDLAEIDADAGRHDRAVDLLGSVRSAGKEVPADLRARATYLLGVSEFRLEHFDKAAALMDEFLAGKPGALGPSALLVSGESQFRLARHEKAVERLRQVVEKHPDDPAAPTAMLRLGESLAALQQWSESERVFEAYLNRYKDSELWFQARFGLGWARENQSKPEDAIACYREVAEKHEGPTAARAQFQIGECLFGMGKNEEAAKELMKVDILYAYPEWSAAALFEAGRCFEAMGDPDRARAQYQAVIERFKDSKWAPQATQRLAAVKQAPLPGRPGGG
ncbi:MAG: tetratricopeptide repeat protein [Phycisphaerales bacterium]|nr:tetratricopeptide repeat protein [Phycisphaerales bacterium]